MTIKRKVWNKGKKLSEEHRLKVIKTLIKQHQKGDKSPFWQGGKSRKNGYILIKSHTHPYRYNNNYVCEHRLVMEEKLGRYLQPFEKVHHINGIKSDNHIENLILISNSEHSQLHRNLEVQNGTFQQIRPNFKGRKKE